jgi:hypothetical protein
MLKTGPTPTSPESAPLPAKQVNMSSNPMFALNPSQVNVKPKGKVSITTANVDLH